MGLDNQSVSVSSASKDGSLIPLTGRFGPSPNRFFHLNIRGAVLRSVDIEGNSVELIVAEDIEAIVLLLKCGFPVNGMILTTGSQTFKVVIHQTQLF